ARHFSWVLFLAALVISGAARAQLMLPGALEAQRPQAAKTTQGPSGAAPRRPKPERLKPPSEEAIFGRELSRDGYAGIFGSSKVKDPESRNFRLPEEEFHFRPNNAVSRSSRSARSKPASQGSSMVSPVLTSASKSAHFR